MKAKISALLTVLIIALSFTGCSNQEPVNEEVNEPLDLTGSWEQEDMNTDGYQAGYITDDLIEIYWISDSGNTANLYWSGSYEAPTEESGDTYSWVSKNDTTRTYNSFLGSSDDEKQFTYANGRLSYEVTALGKTSTISLVKSEKDYTDLGGGYTGDAAKTGLFEVELINSGYTVTQNINNVTISYAVEIKNPNENYAIRFPSIYITSKSEDGKILSTDQMVLNSIAANDTITYGGFTIYEGELPTSVEISVDNDDEGYNYVFQESSEIIYSDDLSISNVSENIGTYDNTYTGEVTNNSKVDLSSVLVSVIYKKDGALVGGCNSYVNNLDAGETKAFEISAPSSVEDYDSYEIHAYQ